jgi:hypothetical protein
MSEQFETVYEAEEINPQQALVTGVELGLLDAVNLNRFENPESTDPEPSEGVIVPALRRATDFMPGELLWFYEPPLYPSALTLQFVGIEPRTGFLHCKSPGSALNQYLPDPTYYGLWRFKDIGYITAIIKRHPGTGYISPMYYINTIQESVDQTTSRDLIKKTTRKITEIARPRRKP